MAISRILSPEFLREDDHLSSSYFNELDSTWANKRFKERAPAQCVFGPVEVAGRASIFISAACDDTRGSTPSRPEVCGPAVLPLFCLAPHGVFPAPRITSRAVSSYLAFSPLPCLLSKNRRYLFCDTFRHRSFTTALPAYSTRHAAVWCSDFPPTASDESGITRTPGPSAIICHRATIYHTRESGKVGISAGGFPAQAEIKSPGAARARHRPFPAWSMFRRLVRQR
jgi:hypothetical protein